MNIKNLKKIIFLSLIVSFFTLYFIQPKKENNIIKIGFGGDVMLGRLVNEKIAETNYKYTWGNIINLLHQTDLNIVNLETTLTNSSNRVPKVFNFKADPDKVESLKEAEINVVNLANNHILDFNIEGLIETIKTLDNKSIKHVGAGINENDARKPIIIKKNGINIGILGYTDNEPDWNASPNHPGTNYIKVGDLQKIREDIEKIRNKVDILIITIHWGPNMKQKPSNEFIDFAHKIIDLGADIIHGHSSHIFQPIEIYKNKLILYDTGDLVDDYMVDPLLRNDQSFFYIVTIDKTGIKKLELFPLLISNMQANLATGKDFELITKKMIDLSKDFETKFICDNQKLTINI